MSDSNTSRNTTADDFERAYHMQKKAREQAEKLLEEKSRELYLKNQSLEEALNKLSQQQSKLVAQEKLASVGQLGAGLAHELNNPNAFIHNNLVTLNEYILQLISGLDMSLNVLTELNLDQTQANKNTEIQKKISNIKQQSDVDFIRSDLSAIIEESLNGSKRIKNIANGLRSFANPDTSTKKIMNVNNCLHQTQQLLPFDQQQPIPIDIQFELNSLPETMGVPILITQALANIILNAVESAPKSKKVIISTQATQESIVITISDDGSGISKDNLSKIFQPFFTNKQTHNGLGLCIAQSIITQHQGSIHIDSTEGKGTFVKVNLPLNIE